MLIKLPKVRILLVRYILNVIVSLRRIYRRRFSCTPPDLKATYSKLLSRANITNDVPCNYIKNVLGYWGRRRSDMAIVSVHLDSGDRTELAYLDLIKQGDMFASFLYKHGFKKSDSLGLMMGQAAPWWSCVAGGMRAGVALVPCPKLLTEKDLQYRINTLGISGIVVTPEVEGRVDAIRDNCPTLKTTITLGEGSEQWYSFNSCITERYPKSLSAEILSSDPCFYLYTSGTTGFPKPVRHNHSYPYFHWVTGRDWLQATPKDIVYNASDTGWGFTVWTTLAVWATGAKLLITPTNMKFNSQKILSVIRDESVTIFCAAPTVLRKLVAEENFNNFVFPALKRVVTVGEALDETVVNEFSKRNIEVAVGFGQAETTLLLARIKKQPHVCGTMGLPVAPYSVVLLDDALEEVPVGKMGQIAVKLEGSQRYGIMHGYEHDVGSTRRVFSPNGQYYLTGDWAIMQRDGCFVYQGREDDLIKAHGYRIGPDEVEKAAMSHPAIEKVAVIGARVACDTGSRIVKAFVLLKRGHTPSQKLIKDIQRHVKKETSPHQYPRKVEFLSASQWCSLETYSGKISRAALRAREESKLQDEPVGVHG